MAMASSGDRTAAGELAQLVAWARPRLADLVDEVYDAICQRIDLYRHGDAVPASEARHGIDVNLHYILEALADPTVTHEAVAPTETGRRRARQRAPLPDVLYAYRIACAMLRDLLVDHARGDPRAISLDTVVDVVNRLWELTDGLCLALSEAYQATAREMALADDRRRSALVETLLSGHAAEELGWWRAGKELGLPLDAKLAVVVSETPAPAQEGLGRIEQLLADGGIVSAWLLSSALQAGVVSMRDDQRASVVTLLRDAAVTRTGMSPLYDSLCETPRALHLAKAALAGVPAGQAELRLFGASPLAALVASDPDEGQRVAREVLGPVLDLPKEDRTVLADTLCAFLDNTGSAERAAQVMGCHANTVRYRLRRIRELTGRTFTDPIALAELVTAAEAVRHHPPARLLATGPARLPHEHSGSGPEKGQ